MEPVTVNEPELESPEVDDTLSVEDILNADDIKVQSVVIPEWTKNGRPGRVFLKPMTADRIIFFQSRLKDPKRRDGAFVDMFVECACSNSGAPLFKSERDVAVLRTKNGGIFLRMQQRLLEINGLARREKTTSDLVKIMIEEGVELETAERVAQRWASPEVEAKNG